MNNINKDINNIYQGRQDLSGGDVEYFAQEDQAIQRPSASSALPTNSVEHAGARTEDPEDGSMVKVSSMPSDRVDDAHGAGGLRRLYVILQGQRRIMDRLVSAIVANPQAGAAGDAYHVTVPPRYLELGMMRQDMNIRGKFGEAALETRDAYIEQNYLEIADNDWHDKSSQKQSIRGREGCDTAVHTGTTGTG